MKVAKLLRWCNLSYSVDIMLPSDMSALLYSFHHPVKFFLISPTFQILMRLYSPVAFRMHTKVPEMARTLQNSGASLLYITDTCKKTFTFVFDVGLSNFLKRVDLCFPNCGSKNLYNFYLTWRKNLQ